MSLVPKGKRTSQRAGLEPQQRGVGGRTAVRTPSGWGRARLGETHREETETLCPPTPVCSQMAIKSVPFLNTEAWSKELLGALTRPDQTQQEQPPEKVGRLHPWCPPHRPRALSMVPTPRASPRPPKETEGTGRAAGLAATPLMLHHQARDCWSQSRGARGPAGEVAGCPEDRGAELNPSPGLPVHLLRANTSSLRKRHHGQDTPENPAGNVPPVVQAEGGKAARPLNANGLTLTTGLA